MISSSFISVLAAKTQTTQLNVRREYIQHLFLNYLYRQTGSENLYFKGGTALRIVFQSPRFSEDLDFSAPAATIKQIEGLLLAALTEIEREGISTGLKEAKRTSGGYFSVVGFLAGEEELQIQIQVSKRKGKNKSEIETVVGEFIAPYTISLLSRQDLVNEKIQALLTRQKARDFYDLYFILRANLLLPSERGILKKCLKVLDNAQKDFEAELKIFLPRSHWPIIKNFKQTLSREIKRYI